MEEVKKAIKNTGTSKEKIIELELNKIAIKHFTPEITKEIETCKNLKLFVVSECELESLEGMPKLDLEGIDLSGNKYTFFL